MKFKYKGYDEEYHNEINIVLCVSGYFHVFLDLNNIKLNYHSNLWTKKKVKIYMKLKLMC